MKALYRTSWTTGRALLRLLYGFRVEGVSRIPREGGMILAVNHVSYADPVVAGLGVPRELHFFAKRELFQSRLFAALIRAHNALPVDRGAIDRETLRRVHRLLRAGGALLIFPEGTRSPDGTVGAARPGVGMMASAAAVPVVPAYLRGSRRIGRSLFRRGRLALFLGEPVDPASVGGASRKERHRRLGDEVVGRIRALRAIYG